MYGKWKEFYFVIKYGEQKLLYYERESVSTCTCIYMYMYIIMCPVLSIECRGFKSHLLGKVTALGVLCSIALDVEGSNPVIVINSPSLFTLCTYIYTVYKNIIRVRVPHVCVSSVESQSQGSAGFETVPSIFS